MDTTQIRKENKSHILQCLSSGGEFTAVTMAKTTNLSVATANTLLKQLVKEGLAECATRQTNSVGRKTCFFTISPRCSHFVSIVCREENNQKKLECCSFYCFGGFKELFTFNCEAFDKQSLKLALREITKRDPYIVNAYIVLPLNFGEEAKNFQFGELNVQFIRAERAVCSGVEEKGVVLFLYSEGEKTIHFLSYNRKLLDVEYHSCLFENNLNGEDLAEVLKQAALLVAPQAIVCGGSNFSKAACASLQEKLSCKLHCCGSINFPLVRYEGDFTKMAAFGVNKGNVEQLL